MVATLHVPGRLILAGGFAMAMAVAPTVAVLADISAAPGVYVTTADPCTVAGSNGSYSLVCRPSSIGSNSNLPSEQGLTLRNEFDRRQ
jgi:hypothetical protein